MSAIFGEKLTFGQKNGPDVRLVTFGDEHYARYENEAGHTVVYDPELGLFCYARRLEGRFVSTGISSTQPPPADVPRHLQEAEPIRCEKHEHSRTSRLPPPPVHRFADTMRTFAPNDGLLEGRRLSTGHVRGLVILVEFSDATSTVTRTDVHELLNGDDYSRNGNFCSAREYFAIVSDGKLDYENDVVGPFRLSHDRQYYVTHLLVEEALALAVASGVDMRRYDARNEGIIDALSILYAGQTQYLGELWPHNAYINLPAGGKRTNLYLLTSMGRTASDLTIGTFCHESGHLLCRFPDMYDYGNRDGDGVESAGIGSYCLMGSGNHLDSGRTPSPVCAYLRNLAGWCDDVIVLNEERDVTVVHGEYGKLYKFETDRVNEYFLVENRSKLGLDLHLPSSGLAVYHCDTRGSNEWQECTATRHYQCALLQADGHFDLEHNLNLGDGSDLFASLSGVALSHATVPPSRRWDGSDSGFVLSAIGAPGPSIRFSVGEAAPVGASVHGQAAPALVIPDNNSTGIASSISVSAAGLVQDVTVGVDITHSYIGDVIVELVAPSGRTARLHDRTGAGKDNLLVTWTASAMPTLATFAGEQAQGPWILRVRDVAGQDLGKLNRWSLDLGLKAADEIVRVDVTPPTPIAIPDNDPIGIISAARIARPGSVKRLAVAVDIRHPYVGDLRVELEAPTGRRALVHSRLGAGADDIVVVYDSDATGSPLRPLVGLPATGDWILRVVDLAGRDVGTLNKWALELALGG